MAFVVRQRAANFGNMTIAAPIFNQQKTTPTPIKMAAGVTFSKEKLEKYMTVEAALLGTTDNISFFFKDINSKNEISFEPTRSWIPASTIKAYVVLEAYKQRRQGLINFNDMVTIKPENVVATELETDEFPRLREGVQVSIRQLVEAMIIQSDNIAYNTLLDVLDRRNINATLKDLGLTETVVGEKLNLDDNQYAIDGIVPGRQPNTTTAKDYAFLFDLLYQKKFSEADEILSIFDRQKINIMIPALLPDRTIVAHKTGEWSPIYHDGGIVYKPNSPFILTIFTKSNDPAVLAQLARVAYFQTSDVVGQKAEMKAASLNIDSDKEIYLAKLPKKEDVLGVQNSDKFPSVTAEDLGMTLADLSIDSEDIKKINETFITPHSLLYPYKRLFEEVRLLLTLSKGKKADLYINLAQARLSELKAMLRMNDLFVADFLLNESESELQKAAKIINTEKKGSIPKLKAINDLHFAVMADAASRIKESKKEEFIDIVYNFYKQNQKEVQTVVSNSLLANPLQQQPIIGTIKQIEEDKVTLEFGDGQEKTMSMDMLSPIRAYHKKNLDPDTKSLKIGAKIAVIGQTTNEGVIIPQFVLRDIPHEFPDKYTGIILEINPKEKSLKMLNQMNQTEIVKINSDTTIKGKQTDVSLAGIKAGSSITVLGNIEPTGAAPSPNQTQKPNSPENTKQNKTDLPVINATSITVTKNSSGKNEKTAPKSKTPSPESAHPPKDQNKQKR